MREHRSTIGEVLLTAAAASWIGGTTIAASDQIDWSDAPVVGLFAAGAICFVLGVVALRLGPPGPPKPEPTAASHFAEVILKEEGIWPSRWQRLLHPRTPIGELPVRVPDSVEQNHRAYVEGLDQILQELKQSERVLGSELDQGRHLGTVLDSSAWNTYRHVVRDDEVDRLGESARQEVLIRNENSQAVWDTWDQQTPRPTLSSDERGQRRKAQKAVTAARTAIQILRDEAGL